MTDQKSGFDFPCAYEIKAMGLAEPGFEAVVVEIIRRHAPVPDPAAIRTRASRNGRYLSVSVMIEALSREQLDAIYADLTAHDKVLMRL